MQVSSLMKTPALPSGEQFRRRPAGRYQDSREGTRPAEPPHARSLALDKALSPTLLSPRRTSDSLPDGRSGSLLSCKFGRISRRRSLAEIPNVSSWEVTMPAADLAQAAQFLGLLDPVGGFTFQVFPESDGARGHAAVFHGSLEQHAPQLVSLNEPGRRGDLRHGQCRRRGDQAGAKTCRTAANVQRVRAVFVDLDGAPIAPVLESALPPDWVV